ncbi:MAG: TlpA disulfide reductase family protein [Luteolibacter sp.]|jgi:peroxiredoxin|nr:TlpA disulfide reductase family protein [Luteolibacter sp.]
MRNLSRLLAAAFLLLAVESHASPDDTRRIQKSWELAMENWSMETRIATTPEARAAALAKRPDPAPYARQMWGQIGSALDQEWTLEPAAWFLRIAPGVITTQADGSTRQVFAAEMSAVFKALETRHLKSPNLISMCMAMAATGNAQSLAILEKIQASHPDPKTQGVAALAAALILKSFGDDAEIARKRLTYLRKAIIDSSDIDLGGGTTVAKIAENELYVIRFLTKGRIAPDLSGIDSASRPLKLSDFTGRIVLLMFWSSTVQEADRVLQITTEMERKFQGKPFVVIGVNHDPLEKLRSLEADGIVSWRNFSDPTHQLAAEYRVGTWPLVYVLDGARKIQYAGSPGSFAELTIDVLLSETKPAASE